MNVPFKKYNIADWFSFYRIVMAPVLITLALLEIRELFVWLLLLSYCTDMIDGFLARKLKICSPRGSQLDSMGDQLTLIAGLVGLLVFEFGFIREQFLVITIAFSPYLIQMFIAWFRYGRATSFHTYLAKISALLQGTFLLWLLWFGPNYWLFYTMIVLSVLETIEEIALIFIYPEWTSDVKGIFWAVRDTKQSGKQDVVKS